jgi:PKD repeat protein
VNQVATFDATSSEVAFGSITSFTWDFGDGTTVGPPSAAVVTHTYGAIGTYQVTLTEVDSAGTGFAATPTARGPGQTPDRFSGPAARFQATITVTPPSSTSTNTTTPTSNTTGSTTSTTTGQNGSTTTTTVKGHHQLPGAPTLVLNPAVGPPGTIVTVTGHGFRPNTPVTVSWTVSTGSVVITADQHGDLPPRSLLILTPDVLGPRLAEASSSPPATAPFLVVPSTSEPGGDNAGLLFRSEGP